jgi:methanogenic corrinoid protein MtbC1
MIGKYTVNEVEDRTKVPASTLRQWERRYGFPLPERSDAGYRLYSDHDVAQIEAMKRYIEDGVPASRAAELVKNAVPREGTKASQPASSFCNRLVDALVNLTDAEADKVLSEAHAFHPVETVMFEVMKPAMVEIGQRWHDGKINSTTEHFASSYIQGRLRHLLQLSGNIQRAPSIIVACAPGDQHELGALMLAVVLRRSGYRVIYVGANTPVADLAEMASDVKPAAVMISASVVESVEKLMDEKHRFVGMAPFVIFGGMAFDAQPALAQTLGGRYLSSNLLEVVSQLDELIQRVRA